MPIQASPSNAGFIVGIMTQWTAYQIEQRWAFSALVTIGPKKGRMMKDFTIQKTVPFKIVLASLLFVFLMTGCATQMNAPMNVRNELAPTGKLRAGMNLGNNLFTRKDASGQLQGVSVDLMQELAKRLDVPLEMVVYGQPGQVADDAVKGVWDVAILAIEKTRAKTISFSPAMTEIEAGYVVHKNSPLQSADQVDARGMKIAAQAKAGFELFLTNALKNASLTRPKDFASAIEIFNQSQVDAIAGLKPNLIESMDKLPQGKLLTGNFMTVNHGFSTPLGKGAADAYLQNFVKELIASGFITKSIEKHQIKGLTAIKG